MGSAYPSECMRPVSAVPRANVCQVAQRDRWNRCRGSLAQGPVCFNQERRQEVDGEPVAALDTGGVHLLNGKVTGSPAASLDPYGGVQRFQRRRRIPGQVDNPRRGLRIAPAPPPADQQDLADAGVLRKEDTGRIVGADDGVDVKPLGQNFRAPGCPARSGL